MPAPDTTPIRDPRNAVGLLTDVLDLVLRGPVWATLGPRDALAVMATSRDLGRDFAKAPRTIVNGYKRRGTAAFYQKVKDAWETLPEDLWAIRDTKLRELHSTLSELARANLRIIIDAMEDMQRWDKFINGWREPGGRWHAPKNHDPEWLRFWHDHTSSALRMGADRDAVTLLECSWRFRDLTDRSHRGRNVRAAFEAAWLAGHYKFARQLVAEALA